MENLFDSDVMSKRERVEATLNHQPVDRAALYDQVSFNPGVVEMSMVEAVGEMTNKAYVSS